MFTAIAKKFDLATNALASLAVMITVGAALFAGNATAAPIAPVGSAIIQSGGQDSGVTLVRDGCGRGMRFSNSRQACVEDFGGGGPRVVEPGCPRGTRFSNSRQACVPVGGVDPGAAIVNGIINGVVGAPGGCPRGMRWSNGRGRCVYD
jgi:hypothetical protein